MASAATHETGIITEIHGKGWGNGAHVVSSDIEVNEGLSIYSVFRAGAWRFEHDEHVKPQLYLCSSVLIFT